MKNLFFNQNCPIPNPVILNNYSIQNVIISPSKIMSPHLQSRSPIIGNQFLLNHHNSYSPPPHMQNTKNISLQNQNENKQNNINRNYTPIHQSYKSLNTFNVSEYNQIPRTPINVNSSQNLFFPQNNEKIGKSDEKKPETSKDLKLENKKILIKTERKSLKNSMSQRIFQNIQNPCGLVKNFTINEELTQRKNDSSNYMNRQNNLMINNIGIISPKNMEIEPKGKLVLEEFQSAETIGKGTYGKIFCVKWIKNNKLYALKKELLTDKETIEKRNNTFTIIQNFIKNTNNNGVINLYANLFIRNNDLEYQYYELMEKAERDWDQEINVRSQYGLYYKENEIIDIIKQLILTLSLFQKHRITHRDIKPQNILVINGKYKLCDFGEIRVLKRTGLIVQRIRGSELYMSPILYHGFQNNVTQVKHNTFKSDVFSLGMCFYYAASLNANSVDSIRELNSTQRIKEVLFKHLGKRYSPKLIMLILLMLEINEDNRPDFTELETKMNKAFP